MRENKLVKEYGKNNVALKESLKKYNNYDKKVKYLNFNGIEHSLVKHNVKRYFTPKA